MSAEHTPGPWRLAWRDTKRGRKLDGIFEPIPGQELGSRSQVLGIGGYDSASGGDDWLNITEANAALIASAPELKAKVAELEKVKDGAYSERNQLVAALSKVFPASLERHPEDDKDWEDDWRWIVFIDLPAGQCSWHLHDSELPRFAHLKRGKGRAWDGHTTEEKYARLEALELGLYVPPFESIEVTDSVRESAARMRDVVLNPDLVPELKARVEELEVRQAEMVSMLETCHSNLDRDPSSRSQIQLLDEIQELIAKAKEASDE